MPSAQPELTRLSRAWVTYHRDRRCTLSLDRVSLVGVSLVGVHRPCAPRAPCGTHQRVAWLQVSRFPPGQL